MRSRTVEEGVRGVAGTFIVVSLALGYWVHPAWLAFTAFVGLNLAQSAVTGLCPMMGLLRRFGMTPCRPAGPIPAER